MRLVATLLTALVALLHFGFMLLEMAFWNTPLGYRVFATAPDFAAASAVLAANQGLYNGFLAVGLVWSLVARKRDVAFFLLGCIVVAGVSGGVTAQTRLLFVQALPAALAILAWRMAPAEKPAGA